MEWVNPFSKEMVSAQISKYKFTGRQSHKEKLKTRETMSMRDPVGLQQSPLGNEENDFSFQVNLSTIVRGLVKGIIWYSLWGFEQGKRSRKIQRLGLGNIKSRFFLALPWESHFLQTKQSLLNKDISEGCVLFEWIGGRGRAGRGAFCFGISPTLWPFWH